jgi:hypothetical protein
MGEIGEGAGSVGLTCGVNGMAREGDGAASFERPVAAYLLAPINLLEPGTRKCKCVFTVVC